MILLLSLVLAAAQEPREAQVSVTFKEREETPGQRHHRVDLSGTSDLPNGTVLSLELEFRAERISDDGNLTPYSMRHGATETLVRYGKFKASELLWGPGRYVLTVLINAKEHPELVLKTNKWTFDFVVWDDDLPEQMEQRYSELPKKLEEVRTYVDRVREASVDEDTWNRSLGSLTPEFLKLKDRRMDWSPLGNLFPAAMEYLRLILRSVATDPAKYSFFEKRFMAPGLPAKAEPDGKVFVWWDGLFESINEVKMIARREFALSTLNTLRGVDEKRRVAVRKSLAAVSTPALQTWSRRLQECEPADYDGLEKELRARN